MPMLPTGLFVWWRLGDVHSNAAVPCPHHQFTAFILRNRKSKYFKLRTTSASSSTIDKVKRTKRRMLARFTCVSTHRIAKPIRATKTVPSSRTSSWAPWSAESIEQRGASMTIVNTLKRRHPWKRNSEEKC